MPVRKKMNAWSISKELVLYVGDLSDFTLLTNFK